MDKQELFHPRVFDNREWAIGYYKRNSKNITRVGKRFASLLKEKGFKGGRILDTGCGFAAVPIELAKAFPDADITGIDLGDPLLDLGRELIDKEGLNKQINLIKGNVEKLDFDDNSFDLIVNTFMLHIVNQPVKMLNETERVAKKEGNIMLTDLNRGFFALMMKKFRTSYTIDEALAIIKQSDIRKGKLSKGLFWYDYLCFSHS